MENPDQARKAWTLWNQLLELETLLWEIYYTDFLDFCIQQADDPHDQFP